MTRLIAAKAASVAAAFALFATPALAQGGAYYSAKPAAEPAKSSLVTRNTVWKCADGTCVAGKGGERDAIMCELVVQRTGTLVSFSAGGTAFGEDALAKCNARAR